MKSPPTCPRKEHKIPHPHKEGQYIEDSYHWLKEKKNPEVIGYIKEENEFADNHENSTRIHELKDTLYAEFLSRINETDESVPYQNGEYLYYSRTVKGLDYSIYCRKAIKQKKDYDVVEVGEEEIILDMNQIAKGKKYCALSIYELSSDHSILAYGIDTSGDEKNDLYLLTLSNHTSENKDSVDKDKEESKHRQRRGKRILKGISSSFEWSKENDVVYYTRLDHALRPHQLWRHVITPDDLISLDDLILDDPNDGDTSAHADSNKEEKHDGDKESDEEEEEEEGEDEEEENGEVEDEINKEDELILQEDDDRFSVGIGKTRDDRYFHLSISSQVTTEEYLLPTSTPYAPFQLVKERLQNEEYTVEVQDEVIYMLTNQNDCKNGFILRSLLPPSLRLPSYSIYHSTRYAIADRSVNDADKGKTEHLSKVGFYDQLEWEQVIAHDRYVRIENILPFKNYLVIPQRKNGLSQIQYFELPSSSVLPPFQSLESKFIQFHEESFEVYTTSNYQYDTHYLRLSYSSFITPRSVFDYNMNTHSLLLRKEYEVKLYDRSLYHVERLYAPADDPSILIPISLTYRKNLISIPSNQRDQKGSPCLLYGYGAYEIPYDADFNSNLISLLDRGMIVAIAHIRGGGDMGRYWYEDGKLLKKKNTFFDFISCSQYLIDHHYAHPSSLCIYGASAGGLLIGSVLNYAPSLFFAAVLRVPFVDAINTLMDKDIPLTVTEWEEWGNPYVAEEFDYIESYSPYNNIQAHSYPHILVKSGLNDPRVAYFEPTKYCAKMRTLKTDSNVLILKTNMGSGHFGSSGRYEHWKEDAYEFAFLLDLLHL